MTQLEQAKRGKITPEMRKVARAEGIDSEVVRRKIAKGVVVIPSNVKREIPKVCGIGEGLRTKVNVNIGTSTDSAKTTDELEKLKICISAGSDTVMDLSTGGDLVKIRRTILRKSCLPVGSVPIYEAAVGAVAESGSIAEMSESSIFKVLESQAKDGVDFFTIHCGVTKDALARLKKDCRITDVVSRGGAIILEWMAKNKKENPLYKRFDEVLDIAKSYDVALSLGDGMRPGSVFDATDRSQIQELVLLGELAQRARDKGVQVIIEGPGHVPINQIEANVILEKSLCQGAPFYLLGPLVTDIAPGYDHITAAIGGAIAASFGADFLCYVTPSEHLRLPNLEDVREGVIASRIAAHAADIAKGIKGALEWDIAISKARRKRDWRKQIELAIDPQRPREYRKASIPKQSDVCTMCSHYCSMKLMDSL